MPTNYGHAPMITNRINTVEFYCWYKEVVVIDEVFSEFMNKFVSVLQFCCGD